MNRTNEEIEQFKENIQGMTVSALIVFAQTLDDLDSFGVRVIVEEIERRINN